MKLGFNWPAQRSDREKKKIIARNKMKHIKFNPDRAYIEKAVAEYLKKGRKISQLELDDNICENQTCEADYFLMGEP